MDTPFSGGGSVEPEAPPAKKPFDLARATARYHAVAALDPDVGASNEDLAAALSGLDPAERSLVLEASKDPNYKDALFARIAEEERAQGVRGGLAQLDDTDFEAMAEDGVGGPEVTFGYKDKPPPPVYRQKMVPQPAVEFDPNNPNREPDPKEWMQRPTMEDSFLAGVPNGPLMGFAGEIADMLPGVEGADQATRDMAEYQPEALTLGELLGGGVVSALGGMGLPGLGRTVVRGLAGQAPSVARSLAASAATGAVGGAAMDAASRAGHAAPGERLDAAKGAIPFLGREEDPFPLGAGFGALGGLAQATGQNMQSALRADKDVGHTLQHLESLGGGTDLFKVAKPRPGVSMAPVVEAPNPAMTLDDVLDRSPMNPLKKAPPRVMTAEQGAAAGLSGKLHPEAAARQDRLMAVMDRENESFLGSRRAQEMTVPRNTAELAVTELLQSKQPFAKPDALKAPLRAMVEKVVPVGQRDALGAGLADPLLRDSRTITVKRGQLGMLGLDDMLDGPGPSSGATTVRPPRMVAKNGAGLEGEAPQNRRGPLGEPLADRSPGSEFSDPGIPAPRSGPEPRAATAGADDDVKLVLRPMNARDIEGIVKRVDEDVDWKTRDGGYERFSAAARQDRSYYGSEWADTKARHHAQLYELEEARGGLGLGPKEVIDPRNTGQRGKIEKRAARRGYEPDDAAAFRLADTDETRQGLLDLESMSDVRKLTAGAKPGRLDESMAPMSVGTVDTMRMRLDPSMGSLSRQSMGAPSQQLIPALTLRDMANIPGLPPGITEQAGAVMSDREKATLAAEEQARQKRILEQAEALRLAQPAPAGEQP